MSEPRHLELRALSGSFASWWASSLVLCSRKSLQAHAAREFGLCWHILIALFFFLEIAVNKSAQEKLNQGLDSKVEAEKAKNSNEQELWQCFLRYRRWRSAGSKDVNQDSDPRFLQDPQRYPEEKSSSKWKRVSEKRKGAPLCLSHWDSANQKRKINYLPLS